MINGKIAKLEAIRGFAAILVLVSHLEKVLVPLKIGSVNLYDYGIVPVMVFFILSGFVIQISFEKSKNKTFKLYFLKRFFRIYIPLIFIFVVNSLLFLYYGNFFQEFKWSELLGNIFMLQDLAYYMGNICNTYLENSPLWSLSYEWWYYMLFFLVRNKIKKDISHLIYIGSIFATIFYVLHPFWLFRVLMFSSIWWLGADLAKMYFSEGKFYLKKLIIPIGSIVCSMAIMKLCVMLFYRNYIWGYTPFLELAALSSILIIIFIAFIWYKMKWIFFDYTIGFFKIFASISYCIYISHYFLVVTARYLTIENVYIRYSIYTFICFFFSYIVELIIYPKLNKYFMNKIYPLSKSKI